MSKLQTEITHLLDCFFEGSLSPDGVDRLRSLLSETPNLTEEMETAKKILDIFSDYIPEPPENLAARLEMAVENFPSHKSGKPLIKRFLEFGSIAAAIALILWFSIKFNHTENPISQSDHAGLLSSVNKTDTSEEEHSMMYIYSGNEQHSGEIASKPVSTPSLISQNSNRTHPTQAKAQMAAKRGARRITDPDEALAFAQATLLQVSSCLEDGDRMLERLAEETNLINNIINN